MVAKFIKEEGVDEVDIVNVVIMLLFYANDVRKCAKAYEGSGRVLHA